MVTKQFQAHTELKASDLNGLVQEINDGFSAEATARENAIQTLGQEVENGIKTKATIADLDNFRTTGAVLPLNAAYVFRSTPVHGISGHFDVTGQDFIAFCIAHEDYDHTDHTVMLYLKSGNDYKYSGNFDTDDADTPLEKFIAKCFFANVATQEADGLMSKEDKKTLDGMQSEIDTLGSETNNIKALLNGSNAVSVDIASLVITQRSIADGNPNFSNRSSTNHSVVHLNGAKVVNVKSNSLNDARISFLSQYSVEDALSTDTTKSLVHYASGYSGNVIAEKATVTTFEVPEDAMYLYILRKYNIGEPTEYDATPEAITLGPESDSSLIGDIAELSNQVNLCKEQITTMESNVEKSPICEDVQEPSGSDLDVTDENGYVIAEFKEGHFKTKKFDSRNVNSTDGLATVIDDYSDADLNISDENGRVIAQFKEGHLATKNFDSRNIGENKQYRFPYYGERIQMRPSLNYSLFGNYSGAQAGCSYGDYLFRFNTDNTFNAYSISKKHLIGKYQLDGSKAPHCNMACFGREFFEPSDDFPLLYVNAYNNTALPKGTCYVYRLIGNESDGFTTTLVQTITIGFTTDPLWTNGSSDTRPYGNFIVDVDNGYYYAYTLRDTDQKTRFFKFVLPTLSQGSEVTLRKEDVLDHWDCNHFPYIQDNCYHNGKLYLCTGYGTDATKTAIRVIDPEKRVEVTTIKLPSLGLTGEPEYIDVIDNMLMYGMGSSAVYKIEV